MAAMKTPFNTRNREVCARVCVIWQENASLYPCVLVLVLVGTVTGVLTGANIQNIRTAGGQSVLAGILFH